MALARAIAGRPAVLCLDDVTASLDAATETLVWERLRAELPTATIVVVTHRRATLRRASRVAILEEGRLVGDGRLADLEAEPPRSVRAILISPSAASAAL